MSLADRVSESSAIYFDLFHTLFSFKSDGIKGRNTSEVLGIPEDVWNNLLFNSSDRRLRGEVRDKYSIIRELAKVYDPRISEERVREAADLREVRFRDGLKNVRKETVDTLARLKRDGKKLGLISNADSVEVAGWGESPLASYFDTVIFSFEVGSIKPEPEIYRRGLATFGVSAEESLFVGDGGSDELRGARSLGFTTVFTMEIIQAIWPQKIDERKLEADFSISRLSELLER
ncbi:haloacid dehalogenase-like hydrolase, putative [Verrucomicrobiia bacterium DG1235]|nr:haloacid dehalogenase-like hydrolase, putative [Verrucomicrobiae bacterium DG1235]